ncbi:MAG: hypothetical protein LBH38_02075 [Holosporales bacterium]|jgi:hypothetical protein|nr:hypothetical protein [Holosporales bacterium]
MKNKVFYFIAIFIPIVCIGMETGIPEDSSPNRNYTQHMIIQTPSDTLDDVTVTERAVSLDTLDSPNLLSTVNPNNDVRFTQEPDFPMQILSESKCIDCCLRCSTVFCFFSRGTLNILSAILYAAGGTLLLAPGMTTDSSSTLKMFNMFAVFAVAGAVACRELATRSQRHIIDNEEEFARIQAYREQQCLEETPYTNP